MLQPSVCSRNGVSEIKAVETTLMSVKEIKREEGSRAMRGDGDGDGGDDAAGCEDGGLPLAWAAELWE